jgi:hypothetical protein
MYGWGLTSQLRLGRYTPLHTHPQSPHQRRRQSPQSFRPGEIQTVSAGQIFALDTIEEDQRGRLQKQHQYKKSFGGDRATHSPTGSLDPIFSGNYLGVGGDKVGSEVLVTAAAVDAGRGSEDDGTSRVSSFDDGKPHAR